MSPRVWKEVFLSFRPKTLTAAFVPCVAGTALVAQRGFSWSPQIFWYALLSAFFIQIGTNLVNDASDYQKGADTDERIGPRRITAAGVLKPKTVWMLAGVSFLLAIVMGVPLVIEGGWAIVCLGLVSVLMGYAYTAGPYPLAYVGLGDIFVVIFFGLVAVGGMAYLHARWLDFDVFWLGLQIGLHATALIAINNLRDADGDQKVGKKTLAVRFGKTFSRIEISALCLLPFLMNFYWWQLGDRWAVTLSCLALPFALRVILGVWSQAPGPIYNRFLGLSAAMHLVFGSMLSVGWWLA